MLKMGTEGGAMLRIKNAKNLDGELVNITQEGPDQLIDAKGEWTVFPALIDPHVHFPLQDWSQAARNAVKGGITTVIDFPTSEFLCSTKEQLETKKTTIDKALQQTQIPLHYRLVMNAQKNHLEDIGKAKKHLAGVLIPIFFLEEKEIKKAISIANLENLFIVFQSEQMGKERAAPLKKALRLAERYDCQTMIPNVTSKEELHLIRDAKAKELKLHTMISIQSLITHSLWEGIHDGTIDMVCSDNAVD